ncbi:hypothetical protein EON73_02400 [bacterium]|nr:MAG: hypothetical protein EON73_02400 [bacterium]
MPLRLENSFSMDVPNQVINIYEGSFTIKGHTSYFFVKGLIKVEWIPNLIISFNGEVINKHISNAEIEVLCRENTELFINERLWGRSQITYMTKGINIFEISGKLIGRLIIGEQPIAVDILRFTIPNLRSISGEHVKRIVDGGFHTYRSRFSFENKHHKIILDQRQNHDLLHESLEKQGGFLIFYNVEYKRNDLIKITESEANTFVSSFSRFLTLINGSRSSPMFIEGVINDKSVWTDYSIYPVDSYKEVQTWSTGCSVKELNDLWGNFHELWKKNEEFLTSITHWYVEVNRPTNYVDGNLTLVQTALELIYNWFIIEKGKLLYGIDADNISAANKIRLLLSKLNVTSDIPKPFTALQETLNGKMADLKDGPGVTSYIRNCIVHSKAKNRENLKLITEEAKSQSLQLCLWYVELSILKILGYKGKYYNRCSGKLYRPDGVQLVPWI